MSEVVYGKFDASRFTREEVEYWYKRLDEGTDALPFAVENTLLRALDEILLLAMEVKAINPAWGGGTLVTQK